MFFPELWRHQRYTGWTATVLKRILEECHMVHDNLTVACLGSGQTDVYQRGMRWTSLPLTPYDRSCRRKRILWSAVSNAAVLSRTASTDWWLELESSALMRSEYTFNSAVSVEWPCLYADWFGGSREWVSTCDCSWLLTRHSSNFETKDKFEIGL